MNLNDAKSVSVNRKRATRVGRGRGSGCGKTSRRGMNGASSRSGWGGHIMREGGQMPLARRLPKKGFNNANFRVRYEVVNVDTLAGLPGGEVTPDTLKAAGIIKRSARWVKVLGKGELEGALQVSAHHFSKGARDKIEKAGGTVTVLPGRHGRTAEPSKGERHAAFEAIRTVKVEAHRAEAAAKPKAKVEKVRVNKGPAGKKAGGGKKPAGGKKSGKK